MERKKSEVENFLKRNREPEFIAEISRKSGIPYPTLIRWIKVLEEENKIEVKIWGGQKFVRWLK